MVDGISSQQSGIEQMQHRHRKPPSAEEMFKNLSSDVGGDGTTITKDQLESYIQKLESDGSGSDKGKLGFLKQLDSNFDKIAGGNDSITVDSLKNGMEYLKPPSGGSYGSPPSAANVFSDLAQKVGADSNGITKDQLESYLQKLQDNGNSDSKEADMISKLVDDFDNISGGTDTITADSLQQAFQSRTNSRMHWQDPSTITSDQLQSPIDIRV